MKGCIGVLLILGMIGTISTTLANWPSLADTNLVICARTADQVTPKVVATSDGGCYVSWYDLSSGNYDVYLQRLDSNGVVQWANCGILVDGHAQDTWITDYDMKVDAEDCAIIAVNDIRTDPNRNIYAYRVNATGQMMWGPDGLTLSSNNDFEPGPLIAVTSGGNVAFAWQETIGSHSVINVRKVTAGGVDVWNPATITMSIPAGYGLSIPRIVAADSDAVIVEYLVQTGTSFMSPRDIYAQKFDSLGTALWGGGLPISVIGQLGIQMFPDLIADGAGGAYCYWYDAHDANRHHVFVQHILSNGTMDWQTNGVQASLSTAEIQMSPTLARVPGTHDVMLFYMTANPGQTLWGLGGQLIDSLGGRQWTENGIDFEALNGQQRWDIIASPQTEGATVVYFEFTPGSAVNMLVRGFRVGMDGNPFWAPSPRDLCSVAGGKSYLDASVNHQGQVIAVWMDQRSDASGDLYLQNINPDGSLGDLVTPQPPSLAITSPVDSAEVTTLPLPVIFEAHNFAIAPSGGDGVLAVRLNGANVEWHTSTQAVQIASLADELNSIVLELVDYQHAPLNPPVVDSVRVTYTPDAARNEHATLPTTPELYPAYPNPFNPAATIVFALPKSQQVRLTVYDVLGSEVVRLTDGTMNAGYHSVQFDGTQLAGGVYFCRLQAGSVTRLQKLMLLK